MVAFTRSHTHAAFRQLTTLSMRVAASRIQLDTYLTLFASFLEVIASLTKPMLYPTEEHSYPPTYM